MNACMTAYALLIDWMCDLLLQLGCSMCASAQFSGIILYHRLLSIYIISRYAIEPLDAFSISGAVFVFMLQLHACIWWMCAIDSCALYEFPIKT